MQYQFFNDVGSALASNCTSSATTITVASSAGYPGGTTKFVILIGSELMLVTGVSGTTWTVTRGVEGTTAAAHTAGDAIYGVLSAAALLQFLLSSDGIVAIAGGNSFGPLFPLTPPDSGSFSLYNNSGGSLDSSQGVMTLAVKNSSSAMFSGAEMALSAAPFTVIAALSICYGSWGIYVRNSSNDAGQDIRYQGYAGGQFIVEQSFMSTFGSYSSLAASSTGNGGNSSLLWLKIHDDGTHRTFSFGPDGKNFTDIYTGLSSALTPDKVGIACETSDTSMGSAGTVQFNCVVYSFEVTYP